MTEHGLSPRVRGNPTPARRFAPDGGSIPACAGESGPAQRQPDALRVYPRVCGGIHDGVAQRGKGGGLSPRVRGNPAAAVRRAPA